MNSTDSIGNAATKKASPPGLLSRFSRSIQSLRIPGRASVAAKAQYKPEERRPENDFSAGPAPTFYPDPTDSCSSGGFAEDEQNLWENKKLKQQAVQTPVRHKSSFIAHRAAVMRARSRSQESLDFQEKREIEVGKQVTVTTDVILLERSIKAAGMLWPNGPSGRPWTRKLGVSGTIVKVDMGDSTVELSDNGWVPITALEGFDSWKRQEDAASSMMNGKVVTDSANHSEEELQPQVNPEVTPEATVSEAASDLVADDEAKMGTRKKSRIKRASNALGARSGVSNTALTMSRPIRSRFSFFDDLEDSASEDVEKASSQTPSRSSPVRTIQGKPNQLQSWTQQAQIYGSDQSPPALKPPEVRRISEISLLADDSSQPSGLQYGQQMQMQSNSQSSPRLRPLQLRPPREEWGVGQTSLLVNDSSQPDVTSQPPSRLGLPGDERRERSISQISLFADDASQPFSVKDAQSAQQDTNGQPLSRLVSPFDERRISEVSFLADDLSQPAVVQDLRKEQTDITNQPSSRLITPCDERRVSQVSLSSTPSVAQDVPQTQSYSNNQGDAAETLQEPTEQEAEEAESQLQAPGSRAKNVQVTRQPKTRTSRTRTSQQSNLQVGRRASGRAKSSSRPRRGSLSSRKSFVEDDLFSPPRDESEERRRCSVNVKADNPPRKESALGRMLNESSDDSMDGEICVLASRRGSAADDNDAKTSTTDDNDAKKTMGMKSTELQSDEEDGRRSTGRTKSTELPSVQSVSSRCSFFSDAEESDAEACSEVALTPRPSEQLELPAPGSLSAKPDGSQNFGNLLSPSDLKRRSTKRRSSAASWLRVSMTRSRHINWRHSRVQSVCQSNLLDEAMARVASGEQAMHPERAKSGFSLFKRMKSLLEAQDFDDSTGQRVIENIFFDSIPKKYVEIRSIEQVLRIDLLKRFLKKVSDESGSIECTFHGTQEKYVQDILDIGLCPNLCATGAYGRGAYVGTHAGVAHQYADPNSEGWRHMCVVLVLVGQKVVKGKEGEQCPATALDSLANPTQYCFVDDERLYISHLITYRVQAGAAKRTGGGWDDPFQRRLTTAVSKAAKMRNKSGRR